MSATRARMSLTALVVFAVAGAGCGTGRDERSIGAVTDRFYEALRAHAGTRACNQLSKGASDALESASGQACEQAITDLTLPGVGAARSAVYEDSGRVEVAPTTCTPLCGKFSRWKRPANPVPAMPIRI